MSAMAECSLRCVFYLLSFATQEIKITKIGSSTALRFTCRRGLRVRWTGHCFPFPPFVTPLVCTKACYSTISWWS